MCYTPCTVANLGNSFFLSTAAVGNGPSLVGAGSCPTDFLMVQNGADASNAASVADRYCGQQFNPAANTATSAIVCSKLFRYFK